VPVAPPVQSTAHPSISYPVGALLAPDRVRLGPDLDEDALSKLIGSVEGRRVLELGCGNGSNAIALARGGAKVIVVDSSAERLAAARKAADEAEVRVEFHHSDLADLAFVRVDQIDLALAVYSLGEVWDIARVFRQVHRVARTEAPFIVSLAHPLHLMTSVVNGLPTLTRNAFDESTVAWSTENASGSVYPHRLTDVVTAFTRSNFRVDTLLEPQSLASPGSPFTSALDQWVPATMIVRGRKQGI
jgi:SAM-dependent methyltransferase